MKLNLSQISTDTSKFQFRNSDFDETRVTWLIENWDAKKVDPLDVWKSGDAYYLLSGHHRHEAMKRLGIQTAECRIQTLDLQQAQVFALTSNANRLSYTDYEYCRCVAFLIDSDRTVSEAANQMTISPGMARKYYSLRFLVGTDWETHNEKFELTSRAFEIGAFCETNPLNANEIQALFAIVTQNDLNVSQVKQLLRDIKKQRDRASSETTGTLLDLNALSNQVVKAVKERDFLNTCSAQTWWLYELLQKSERHDFPPEIKEPFMRELKRFYSYCTDGDPNAEPVRAQKKGRNLKKQVA